MCVSKSIFFCDFRVLLPQKKTNRRMTSPPKEEVVLLHPHDFIIYGCPRNGTDQSIGQIISVDPRKGQINLQELISDVDHELHDPNKGQFVVKRGNLYENGKLPCLEIAASAQYDTLPITNQDGRTIKCIKFTEGGLACVRFPAIRPGTLPIVLYQSHAEMPKSLTGGN